MPDPYEWVAPAYFDRAKYVRKPIYHDDPIDPSGALVVLDWGDDLTGIIKDACGLDTQIFEPNEAGTGAA